MKVSLNINQQTALLTALSKMDTYECIVNGAEGSIPKIVKVPYKLGSVRRIIVQNMKVLTTSLQTFNEARMSLVKEYWPDIKENIEIKKADDPEKFSQFEVEFTKMLASGEELELFPLPSRVLYADGSEFPIEILAVLEVHGLIQEETAK